MDKNKERHGRQKREDFSNGHSILYQINVDNLFLLPSWPFLKKYKTECKTHPTYWELKVDFPEVKEDGTTTLSVTLKRNDSERNDPDATVSVWLTADDGSAIFPLQVFDRDGMFPGDIMNRTVQISPYPDKIKETHETIDVHLTIKICHCHADENPRYSLEH